MKKALFFPLQVSLYTFGYLYASGNIVQAQVVPDGTVNTIVNQNGEVTEITGGNTSGNNLFHSFQDFSLSTGASILFDNAPEINNILSRVTGGNISNIDGLIRTSNSSNLFLINPAGIIIGENASIDIGGSFYGSTADSILFDDGEFSAVDNLSTPILTINAPIGLSFRDNPSDIVIQNTNAQINVNGGSFNFISGNLIFENSNLSISGGRVQIGGLSEAGVVGLNEDGSLNFPGNVALSDIQLSNSSLTVNASEGDISINTDTLLLEQNSTLLAQIPEDANIGSIGTGNIEILASNVNLDDSLLAVAGFGEGDTGDVLLFATEEIFLDNNSGIFSAVVPGALGNSGDIEISTNSLTLSNGSSIESFSSGQGNSGDISILAGGNINISGVDENNFSSSITTSVNAEGIGDSGDINIEASSINLSDSGQINASVFGQGNGGNITIDTSDSILIDGDSANGFGSGIFSQIFPEGVGNAGEIDITTSNLVLTNGSSIAASTFGFGDAGTIGIQASESINIDGASENEDFSISTTIFSQVGTGATGNAGGVIIEANNLSLTDGGQISASTFGQGDSGSIDINVVNDTIIDGASLDGFSSGVTSNVEFDAEGNAGGINIATDNLSLANDGQINASVFGIGDGGNITINTSNLNISNNGTINIDSLGQGDGGNIAIQSESLLLNNNASISSTTTFGLGGNVDIQVANNLTLDNNSNITVGAFEEATGGNINIDAGFIIAFPSSIPNDGNDIIAQAELGSGGSINISTNAILGMAIRPAVSGNGTNDISAASEQTPFDESSQFAAVDLQNTPPVVMSEQTSEQVCKANRQTTTTQSSFTIRGKGGIPNDPSLPLDSQNISINGDTNSTSTIPQPIETSQGEIQPARGIKVTKDGGIILTAYRTNNSGARIPHKSQNCS